MIARLGGGRSCWPPRSPRRAHGGRSPSEFPPGPGQSEVQAACGPCHAITVVTSARKSEAEWASTVDAMITRGAPVADADYDAIVDYLARNFRAP